MRVLQANERNIFKNHQSYWQQSQHSGSMRHEGLILSSNPSFGFRGEKPKASGSLQAMPSMTKNDRNEPSSNIGEGLNDDLLSA